MASANKRSRPITPPTSGQDNVWLWWQLELGQKKINLKGRERVQLSRYVVNLRPIKSSVVTSTQAPVQRSVTPTHAPINFIGLTQPSVYSLSRFIQTSVASWPRVRDLSLVYVLEICTALIDMLWLPSLTFFIRLQQEVKPLAKSIFLDLQIFTQAVGMVMAFPYKLLNRTSSAPIRYRLIKPQSKSQLAQIMVFLVLALVLILPLKGVATWQNLSSRGHEAIALAGSGFHQLEQAGGLLAQGNPALAQEQLVKAKSSFDQSLETVTDLSYELSGLLGRLPIAAGKLDTAKLLLATSQEVTAAASLMAETMTKLDQIGEDEVFSLGPSLDILSQASARIKFHLSAAASYLQSVDESHLPAEFNVTLVTAKKQLLELEINLASILSLPELFQQILVTQKPQTYVVLFQNSAELRPTGGFAGSLALIEFEQGEVRSINIPGGGPYDFQGSLSRIIKPPEPLRLVRGTWQLQDANWFYDFPTSARKIIWFLQESGGPEAHGVIALNSDIVVALLKLTGPIELPQYGKVLTADNFMRETQAAVEIEYDREENRPKQFIADLAPILFTRLLTFKGQDLINLSALINLSLLNKDIQLYADESSVQARFMEFGWAGQIQSSSSDYLAVVRTNIGGGKTDRVVKEQIKHQVEISPTGELTGRVSIKRTHQGDPRDTFESRRNVSYIRFYVPAGSVLLATQGFTPPPSTYFRAVPPEAETDTDLMMIEAELSWDTASGTRITAENGKTVFANWLSLSPGESKTAEIVYRLPFKLKPGATWQDLRRYSILFQRQSGVAPIDFVSKIIWPQTFRLRWQETSKQSDIHDNKLEMRSNWQTDDYYGIVLERI